MKILERIVDSLIHYVVSIEDTPVELRPRKHFRGNRCGAENAGEMPNSEQIDIYGLPGPR